MASVERGRSERCHMALFPSVDAKPGVECTHIKCEARTTGVGTFYQHNIVETIIPSPWLPLLLKQHSKRLSTTASLELASTRYE